MEEELAKGGLQLVSVATNLIDVIWSDKEPLAPRDLVVHPLKYAGVAFTDKIADLR